MLFVNPDYLNKKDAKVLKAQIEQQAKERRMLEAEYENRLKADMVAMLTEIQLEIEELDYFDGKEPINITQELMEEVKNWEHGVKDCKKLIIQKIDKLRGNEDGK